MNAFFSFRVIALATAVGSVASAQVAPCSPEAPCGMAFYQREPSQPSWIFAPSTYTHDPETGARVAQYSRPAPVEPLDDPRIITSRYRRVRTNLRGTDGSLDSTYDVQNWGNGRGGLDAEWERFHDAWKESYLTGGSFNQQNGNFGGYPNWGYGGGFPNGGYGFPQNGYGGPAGPNGFPPGYGMPPQGPGGGQLGVPWGGQGKGWQGRDGNGPRGDWNRDNDRRGVERNEDRQGRGPRQDD